MTSTAAAESDRWVRFDPQGCARSSSYVDSVGPLAEEAHKLYVPKVADRRREAAEGWKMVRLAKQEWSERAGPCFKGTCTHGKRS